MTELYLGKLSASNASWLSARQSLIAGNVANANTPGFKARDVKAFSDIVSNQAATASVTHSKHIAGVSATAQGINTGAGSYWETNYSGTNVSLPNEMIKASEVATQYQLNTSVMKSFHRMLITAFGV